ncbi:hypothetical protein J4436_00810 [Candidatus Woesearchaeota archaeon]|nr:hypothetical protein [Candidatus Woesearchaeota archaeon]
MSMYLPMYRQDSIQLKNILIKRVISTFHSTKEWDYMLCFGPAIVAYTVSRRNVDFLKIAYVKIPNLRVGYWDTGEKGGIAVVDIKLPARIDWDPLSRLEEMIKCDIDTKISQEFGLNIETYLRVTKEEEEEFSMSDRYLFNIPEHNFLEYVS